MNSVACTDRTGVPGRGDCANLYRTSRFAFAQIKLRGSLLGSVRNAGTCGGYVYFGPIINRPDNRRFPGDLELTELRANWIRRLSERLASRR